MKASREAKDFWYVINELHYAGLLGKLLYDWTTDDAIMWEPGHHMNVEEITGARSTSRPVVPRWQKSKEAKAARTRKKAEVFTPVWVVDKMVSELEANSQELKDWQKYVTTTFLEITCGEGAFITTRYDPYDGHEIPMDERKGILDRKLRLVREHVDDIVFTKCGRLDRHNPLNYFAVMDASLACLKTTYGYEWQGDSLLIARINVLWTFAEHVERLFRSPMRMSEALRAIDIIQRNLWQMDGLRGTIPGTDVEARIMDWDNNEFITFNSMKE